MFVVCGCVKQGFSNCESRPQSPNGVEKCKFGGRETNRLDNSEKKMKVGLQCNNLFISNAFLGATLCFKVSAVY